MIQEIMKKVNIVFKLSKKVVNIFLFASKFLEDFMKI